jgi:GT2 family glycosyltransferase
MTKVAVVILNYNGEKFLCQFLPSVIQYSSEAEIIVADNASTDQSLYILKNEFPQVKVIVLEKNYGFCGGYNRALKQIDATYYVLLNSDIEVTPNWLSPMITLLDKDTSIAATQPKMLSYHHKELFEYAGAAGGFIDALGYPFCRGRIFDYLEKDNHQYDDEREIFWATGACLMVRSSVYHRFNGLDEDFFAHMEEIDLCWKMHRANLKVYYCGGSHVYHVGAGTLDYKNPRKTFLNYRNGLTLVYKHWGSGEILYKFPTRILLDWVASLMYLLKGQTGNCLAVLKAHKHFLLKAKHNRNKRKEIQSQYPAYNKHAIFHGLIIVEYYLRGKKVFNNPK